ncbi:MAG: o-succinylbenzoate synthase [Caldilineales bacterium]|nr:o-succinylbenzoate synthase [Caldilineales bacterium]MDW8316797.1 o-succinylbenzoate synthase [Anaerolineae bacterium]
MRLHRLHLYYIELPFVHPFETSFGREDTRPTILVAVEGDGLVGWGECVAQAGPWYSYETIETAWHILRDVLAPLVLGWELRSPQEAAQRFRRVRGHPMARAALENALWDLFAQAQGVSLAQLLAQASAVARGVVARSAVPVGVSVGIEPTLDELLAQVEGYVAAGYGRVKLKIKPGWDVAVVRAVRERWPDLPLQVDANSAYTLADAATLQALDQFDLLLIEQPLHHEDIVDHAALQRLLRTPICLDESITSPEHARWALDIGACRVINIKVGRVGGFTAAVAIHDLCAQRGVPVWCGGMLETNVGRAGNVALASLPNFTLPGDISASARYFHRDIAEPNFELNADSTITVPRGPGLGVQVAPDRLAEVTLRRLTLP